MRVGDLLEIFGAACLAAAAYLDLGAPAALVVVGIALVYEGQCFGGHPLPKLPRPHLPWRGEK